MRMTTRTRSLLGGLPAALSMQLIFATTGICGAGLRQQTRITIDEGSTNGVCIERNGDKLVIYGDPNGQWRMADMVLFTHGRRDLARAGRTLVENGAKAVVPAAEAAHFSEVEQFWTNLWDKRFHDYAQESTKLPIASLKVGRTVRGGDRLEWQGLTVQVLDTPGYTRGAVSYFTELDGLKYGFIGDLMYGDGQLFDLYSLQDAVAEAQIGGYHGYAGRLGQLIASLHCVLAQQPDVLVPARGPVVQDPTSAVTRLLERLQAVYANYLAVSAGRWYFRDRYDVLARRVLGSPEQVQWMPYAQTIEKRPPDWVIPIHNSRLVVAQDRSALLIDCGSSAILGEVRKLQEAGRFTSMDGLFITHYHDDHTNSVNEFLRQYDCPVYVTPLMEDILRRPGAYRLPAMTAEPIARLTVVPDGHRTQWKGFTLTFYDFPGQTIYHDALLVEHDDGTDVFFIGDSFTPSGMDDYCLQNRNLLREGAGYLYCLDLLRDRIPPQALLINQHVMEPFRFNAGQISHMADALGQRKQALKDLFPWDDVNYGIDEQWARICPYGQEAGPGESATIAVTLLNHSDVANTFAVRLNVPSGFACEPLEAAATAQARQEAVLQFKLTVPTDAGPSIRVVTADVRFGRWDLRQWCEGLVRIAP